MVNRGGNNQRPLWEPTPDQIRKSCLKIQSEWSDDERVRRANRYSVPRPMSYRLWAKVEE